MKPIEYEQMFDVARTYWWWVGTRAIICDAIDAAVADVARPRVLDVGCGAGNILDALVPHCDGVGLDFEMSALQFCRTHLARPLLAQGDARSLPFRDASFDVVLATDVFEHVADDVAAVRECARVCKPGGAVVGAVPAYPLLFGPHDVANGHYRRYTHDAFARILQEGGLRVDRLTFYNSVLLPPIALVRLAQRVLVREPEHYQISYKTGEGRGLVGRLLLGILTLEQWWLRRGNLPAGVSMLGVAVRPAA